MPTLSLEGSVYASTEASRNELVRLAPSQSVDVLVSRAYTTIDADDVHNITFEDLPNDVATLVLMSVTSGSISVAISDSGDNSSTFVLSPGGMLVLMNTTVNNIDITGVEDSIYDLIVGGASS